MICQVQAYSKVIQLYIQIYLLFFQLFSHLGYYRVLSKVPCSILQVLVDYLFYRQQCVHVNPKLSIYLSPQPFPPGYHRFIHQIYFSSVYLQRTHSLLPLILVFQLFLRFCLPIIQHLTSSHLPLKAPSPASQARSLHTVGEIKDVCFDSSFYGMNQFSLSSGTFRSHTGIGRGSKLTKDPVPFPLCPLRSDPRMLHHLEAAFFTWKQTPLVLRGQPLGHGHCSRVLGTSYNSFETVVNLRLICLV